MAHSKYLVKHLGRVLPVLALILLTLGCQGQPPPATATPTPSPVPSALDGLGKDIVYVGVDYTLHRYEAATRTSQVLLAGPALSTWPALSPGGNILAYSAFSQEPAFAPQGVYMAQNPAGRRLLYQDLAGAGPALDPAAPHLLSWSPDGQRLAFLVWHEEGQALFTASATDQWTPHLVAVGSPLHVTWSPDSQSLLVQVGSDLVRFDVISGARTLPMATNAAPTSAPAWSPDGQRVAYATRGSGSNSLTVSLADGTGRLAAAAVDGIAHFLWSPDGAKIAVGQSLDEGDPLIQDLRLVDPLAGDTTTLFSGPLLAFFWSPDGIRLAYVTPSEDGSALQWHTINAATGQGTLLATFVPTGEQLALLAHFDRYASTYTPWSSDGTRLLFAGMVIEEVMGEGNDAPHVYVLDVNGAAPLGTVGDGQLAAWTG